ncbi:aminoglycoside phosphotransferase family protein [Actinomadura barringtoniae]|uniref:Aminoglycoside phosphotransferase family protein n=1 Tax=Actinomadura barringtoniae TaxID=1427535 RepID=A0A939TAF4_9ACTN|nr:aminoglycoside phosphotransferase family protein [Actinomadura barringtoniae]MBO2455349.1 aminoglycoside phosphotransferase family protein [Actinomadura barringtoniae]
MAHTFTHDLQFGATTVTKRFTSWERGEPAREWQALQLLAGHAPGLAPAPVRADLSAVPPAVTMTRLAGISLRGLALEPRHLEGMASALTTLHGCVPADVLRAIPPAPWNAADAVVKARSLRAAAADLGDDPIVEQAFADGVRWLDAADLEGLAAEPVQPVFGLADGNLANYLWDDPHVRMLDFEDSGRSDAAFELAELVEHLSARASALDGLLALVEVDDPARLRELRRLLAFTWLCFLEPGGPAHARNPAGTLRRQAERVLGLL